MNSEPSTHPIRRDRLVHDALHPGVYRIIIGLTIWLVLSVWLLFNRGPYVGLNLAIVTVFFLIAVGVPLLLTLAWRRNRTADEQAKVVESFREWARCEFSTWTGGVSGTEAAIQILLPIAAVAIGMTIFGLVFYFDVPSLG
jgi:hypothetical protein